MEEWCESFKLWKEYAIDYGNSKTIAMFNTYEIYAYQYSTSSQHTAINLILNCLFTLHAFLTYITLLLHVGNYEQGDENRQLGAKLDDLKIDIEGDDDDDSGHHGVSYWLRLNFYILFIYFFQKLYISSIWYDLSTYEMKLYN